MPQNYETAVKWYRLAAKQNNAWAQANLGVMNRKGLGVEKNLKKAAEWFTLAAKQNIPWAQVNIGRMHKKGEGGPPNPIQAYKWLFIVAGKKKADDKLKATAAVLLEELSAGMSDEQISAARALANGCVGSNYKTCD